MANDVPLFKMAGQMFVQIDNLSVELKEFVLTTTLIERNDPLLILEQLESEALERGYKDVHQFIEDIKQEK